MAPEINNPRQKDNSKCLTLSNYNLWTKNDKTLFIILFKIAKFLKKLARIKRIKRIKLNNIIKPVQLRKIKPKLKK